MKVNKVEERLKKIMNEINFFPTIIKNTRGLIMYKHFMDLNTLKKVYQLNSLIKENFKVKNEPSFSRPYNNERNVRINIVPLSINNK